jgi:thioredoxin 1
MTTTTHVRPVTTATFDEAVLGADRPVLVDLWAEWCPPCVALAPILDGLAAAHADRMDFVSVDIDAEPEIATRYQVMSFPTLLVFVDGELRKRLIGARGRGHLLEELTPFLGD